jgi:hypothetical protein
MPSVLAFTSPPPTIGELCAFACVASVNNAPGNNVCPSPAMEHTPRKPRRFNPEKTCSLIPALLHPVRARIEVRVTIGAGTTFSRYQIYDVAGVANPYTQMPQKLLHSAYEIRIRKHIF